MGVGGVRKQKPLVPHLVPSRGRFRDESDPQIHPLQYGRLSATQSVSLNKSVSTLQKGIKIDRQITIICVGRKYNTEVNIGNI